MLIAETCRATHLTKKAIEYYTEQELICPKVLNNGYRDFSENDVECLKRISVFRKLGLGIEEIKAVLSDESGSVLQKLSVQKELSLQREQAKKTILDKITSGKSYAEINAALEAIDQKSTIAERLLDTFPGYYGCYICLHFARFLNKPIQTAEQQAAYEKIIEFLDNVHSFEFPKELQAFLIENTKHIGAVGIHDLLENMKQSIANPEAFMNTNKEMLEEYLAYKQSDAYKESPMYSIQSLLKEFNRLNGYYDVFIPAMKELSASYKEYCQLLEMADKKLRSRYPEINHW